MLGAQTGRNNPRKVFADAYFEIAPTPEERQLVTDRLNFVFQTMAPILAEHQISPSEALGSILSFVVQGLGQQPMEDATDAVYFECVSLASAATLVAVTDYIVSAARMSK